MRISRPENDWEIHGDLGKASNPPHVNVNEDPQFLEHNGELFIIYSASGCWTDYYALGMLVFNGTDNLLNASAWTKSKEPVFKQSPEKGVYAPGHNSFFTAPGSGENWILYHANDAPGLGCSDKRSPRIQPFTWNRDGTPHFGKLVKKGEPLKFTQ